MRRLTLSALALLVGLGPVVATEVIVSATAITQFAGVPLDQPVDGLIWRGGVVLISTSDQFGGLSGMAFTGPDHRVVFVSDRGSFVAGRLAYDGQQRLVGLADVTIEPMRNSKGAPLPRQYARDAEGVDTVYRNGQPVAVRVSFENLTRVAEYTLTNWVPGGAATELPLPKWLSDLRTNSSLEAVCIAPPASPVAGSTVLITEGAYDAERNHKGWLLGQRDQGPLSYASTRGVNPTECAFLPNGDMLVLERGLSMLNFTMNLRRVPAAEVRPGGVMTGDLLLSASGAAVDNMEAMAVYTAPSGETRIVIGSDDNFSGFQRTMLLEFGSPN